MAKKRAKAAKKKSAKKAPPRPRTPARRNQEPSAVRRGQQTEMAAGDVDLADVLGRIESVEVRLGEAVSLLRAMADAKAGESTPSGVPTPTLADSVEERSVAVAATAFVSEVGSNAARMRETIDTGEMSAIDGCRDTLWAMETRYLRGAPRASFVARAIWLEGGGSHARNSTEVYDAIYTANDQLLSPALQRAVQTLRLRVHEDRRETGLNNAAASAITKNIKPRIELLAERLRYVEVIKNRTVRRYRLSRLGAQVFDCWPNWHAADAVQPSADAADPPEGDGAA
jgi:hypothetical protein